MSRRAIRFLFIQAALISLQFSTGYAVTPPPAPQGQQPAIPSDLAPPKEDVAKLEEAIEDPADEKTYDIPMILNDSVENHLEYFKTRGRNVFQIWLERSERYIPMMKKIFREKNLPEDLVYVAMIESGFNPYAVSWAKAVGPWQFMPHTGKLYGLKIDWWVDERKDPIKSTYAAAEHLKDLHNLFGSWPLALASYNAGAGKVQRAVLRTRSEDFWDLKASRYIRRETKNYIPKYMAATIIAKNPAAYGFSTSDVTPYEYDEVEILSATDLRLVARCAGVPYQNIKELNPELRRWITPPDSISYTIRLPKGTKQTFLTNFAAVPEEQKIRWERHEIRPGETLVKIAELYNSVPGVIKEINGVKGNRVLPGRHLLVPVDINGKPQDTEALTPAQEARKQKILYRVRRGETLSKIARNHDCSVQDIREWNRGLGKTIRAGQKIRLVVDVDQI
jgi:membrane-bound lytic murein transglycosylase D